MRGQGSWFNIRMEKKEEDTRMVTAANGSTFHGPLMKEYGVVLSIRKAVVMKTCLTVHNNSFLCAKGSSAGSSTSLLLNM
jgi:hypothetical protein